jgi:dTDP-4-amino-4,6-dideoxy-D-galactose acyltransferase
MAENPELCSLLDWDSTFFGVTIARVNANRLQVQTAAQIMEWCRDKGVRCLYFLADSNHVETVRLAETNGFYLTDVRVTFELSTRGVEKQTGADPNVRAPLPEDLPAMRAIANSSYHNTRFYYDEHFSREACDRLYETWIEKSVNGYAQAVLVVGKPGQPEGFITCHTNPPDTKGHIGLIGVSEVTRGRGIGRTLLLEALQWFADQGMASMEVVTQGRNVAAQRLYQKCGFATKEVKLWYHHWFGEK